MGHISVSIVGDLGRERKLVQKKAIVGKNWIWLAKAEKNGENIGDDDGGLIKVIRHKKERILLRPFKGF